MSDEYKIVSPVVSEGEAVPKRDYAEMSTTHRLTVSVAGQADTEDIQQMCGQDVQAWIRLLGAQEVFKVCLCGVPVAYLPKNWVLQDLIVPPTFDLIDRTSLLNSILDHMKNSGFKNLYLSGESAVSEKYQTEVVQGLKVTLNPL